VLQTREPEGEPKLEERPPWRWISLGAVATFLVWLPLAALVERVVQPLAAPSATADTSGAARLLIVGAHALAFFAGAFAGGLLVGRLGGKAGRREAALAGAAAGTLAWLIAASQGTAGGGLTWGLLLVIMAMVGAGGGALGGSLGLRLRPRAAQ
jgi:MFS family permease